MYYYWIPVAILLLAAVFSDACTWSPFRSEQVREICAHMTKTERRVAVRRSAMWGVTIGVIPGLTALVLGAVVFRSAVFAVAVCFLVLPIAALVLSGTWLPALVASQKRFLASTEWAGRQGIQANDIQLYKWKR
jgi:hypothetical protein